MPHLDNVLILVNGIHDRGSTVLFLDPSKICRYAVFTFFVTLLCEVAAADPVVIDLLRDFGIIM